MSQVKRFPGLLAIVGCALVVLVAGCSKKRGTPFDPDSGHPDGFFSKHGASYSADGVSCTQCHGKDLLGGIVKVSCYSASSGDQSCHSGGPGTPEDHGSGWSAASSHGASAKSSASSGGGFTWCQSCHGTDFKGGTYGKSCFGCHGLEAPHPKAPWRGSLTHTTTNSDNAAVCAACHQDGSGTPGCFNNTLCHGSVADHPDGWNSAGKHGASAKGTPGTMSGFASCKVCHGSGFSGGTSGQSCLVNSGCHGWSAPHGKSGWDGGGSSHRTTKEANALVCADCHRSASGTAGCYNNTLCHGTGSGHAAGWSAASQHGASAKAEPGSSSGMLSCASCHGSGFTGGTSGQSCLISGCHGWSAPHGKSGWDGGGSSHRTTGEGNAGVCADCHRSASGTAGCYNNTLCHGTGSTHAAGWSAGSQHGVTAKATPGSSSGMGYCANCHGSGFSGGTSGQSCLVNSGCHGWGAPHAKSSWDGGGSSHRTTNVGNAGVCAVCHPVAAPASGSTCLHNGSCHDDD